MSTILDALRKLEEERRLRTADVRSRLLWSSAHYTRPLKAQQSQLRLNKRLPGVLSIALTGFAAGAGFMLLRSDSPSRAPEQITPASFSFQASDGEQRTTIPSPPPRAQASAKPVSSPPPSQANVKEIAPSPAAALMSQPTVTSEGAATGANLTVGILPPPALSPGEEKDPTIASASTVQRSPFVAPLPPPREAAVKPRPPTLATPTASPPEVAAARDLPHRRPPQSQPPATNAAQEPREAPLSTPSGTSLSFLQWSSDPERRIAFLRVNGGPLTMAHEGDTVGGYTVVEIRQNAVELQSGETRITLRAQ